MKAAETDLAPSERLFVQVGLRVRIRLPPPVSPVRTGTFDDLAMATLGEMMRPVVLEDGRIGVRPAQWILEAATAINNALG